MAGSILELVSLCSVLLVAWADDRVLLTAEDERLWNTPPELTPQQTIKTSNLKDGRSLSVPVTTNINVNSGNNAHSLGIQGRPEVIGYSESNSFSHALSPPSGVASQSQPVSFSAGLNGIAGAVSEIVGQFHPILGTRENINLQSLGLGSVAASSSGSIHNGHATSSAASSIDSSHSSASSGAAAIGSIQHTTTIRFPGPNQNRPIWTNIRPNHNNNGRPPSRMPTLEIEVSPHRGQNRKPITLHVSTQRPRWENRQPTVHISKWRPNYRGFYDDE